jgi:hypothetical protein
MNPSMPFLQSGRSTEEGTVAMVGNHATQGVFFQSSLWTAESPNTFAAGHEDALSDTEASLTVYPASFKYLRTRARLNP